MRAIRWTLDHPVAVFTTVATLGILAAASFAVISVELSPPSELPELRLSVQWPGASAFTVESEVTRPLESLAQQLDHVTGIRSQTREGSTELVVQFDTKANIGLLEVELNERVHQLYETMPAGVLWPVIQRSVPEELADLAGFLSYRLYGDRRPGELREYAETRIQKALLAVPGIKDAQLEGGEPLELAIEIDGKAATSAGISSEDIEAFQRQLSGGKSSLGTLWDAGTAKKVRFDGGYDNLETLKRMPVGPAAVRLGHIARVYWDAPDDFSRIRINGKNSVLITIEKYPGVDLLETSAAVKAAMANAMRDAPRGIGLVKELDKGEDLKKELAKLGNRSFLAVLFIAAIVIFTYKRVSATLLIWGTILLVLAYTVGLLHLAGMTLNVLTLAGLTVGYGLSVDNSVVVYDSVQRHLTTGGGSAQQRILAGVAGVLRPLLASNLTTVGALLPVFFLSQTLQLYFEPVALALGATVLFSFLVSCLLLPPLMLVLDRRRESAA